MQINEAEKTILLVEDDFLLAMTETLWLNKAGYKIIHVPTGEKAIETVYEKKNEIDLILMDINLGKGIDGTEAAQEILKENDIPILFLSSHTEKEVVEKTEKITSYGYVVKDSKDVVLLASIKMAFKLHHANKELRNKEKALLDSQKSLRRAEFISKTGNWEWQLNSGTSLASEGASKIYGITTENWDIADIQKIPLPEYREKLDKALRDLVEHDRPYDVEFKIKKPDTGEVVDIRSVAEFDRDENKIFGVMQDISDNKRAQESILETQAFYHSLVENIPASVFRKDLAGRYVYVNSIFCELKGLSEEEIIGKTPRELAAYELASDAKAEPDRIKAIQRTLALQGASHHEIIINTGQTIELEEVYTQPNGETKYYQVVKSPVISKEGKIIGSQGIQFDITERKMMEDELHQSEERFRSFVENANDIVFTLSLDGVFTYVSPNWTEVLGHDVDEIIGQHFEKFVHPDDQKKLKLFFKIFTRNGAKQYGIEYRVSHKNGMWRWHSSNAALIKDTQGDTISLLGIARDITERKESEYKLQKYMEDLKEINATKDKFFSIISHDLKNPFLSINSTLKLILDEDEPISEYEKNYLLNGVLSTSERAYLLLENLLMWSRHQTGNFEFRPESVDLSAMVLNNVELMKNLATLKKIKLISNINQDVQIYVDKNMIETVFRNLLTNAIKYTKEKGEIKINSYLYNGSVEVTISDDGIGIPETDLKKLFRIDQSFSTQGTNNETGTGLGLIICKEFIEKNNGKINIESTLNKGTKITFSLPIYK